MALTVCTARILSYHKTWSGNYENMTDSSSFATTKYSSLFGKTGKKYSWHFGGKCTNPPINTDVLYKSQQIWLGRETAK